MEFRDTAARRRTVVAAAGAAFATGLLSACSGPAGNTATGRPSSGGPSVGDTTSAPAPETAVADEPRVVGTVATNLDTPWSIVFLPDGSALVSERDTGAVRKIGDDGAVSTLGVVPGVAHGGEGGLLGLEPSPHFDDDALLYAYFTATDGNRVSRFTVGDDGLGPEQPVLTAMPSAGNHNGGRIKFGPDGALYVGTGDAGQRDSAQEPDSPSGKILRLEVSAADSLPLGRPAPLMSTGHRNVQGLAWDGDGRMWSTEFGPDRDDELNLVRRGGNYGWPEVTGAADDGRFTPAVHVWPSTGDASPSALAIVDGHAYVACLRGQRLWRLPLPRAGSEAKAAGSLPGAQEFLRGQYGRLRDVVAVPSSRAQSPGHELWVATNEGPSSRILRVSLAPV